MCILVCFCSSKEGPPALIDSQEDVEVEVDAQDAQVQQGHVLRVVDTLVHACKIVFKKFATWIRIKEESN
jgi:hypothetical protein